MTNPATQDDGQVRAAMEHAGRALHDGADLGPLFLEERTDVRVLAGSGRNRDIAVTRSRGAAAGTFRSLHVTDPRLDDLTALVRGDLASVSPRMGSTPPVPAAPVGDVDSGWIVALVSSLEAEAEAAIERFSGARWAATLVAFNQKVWVVTTDAVLRSDTRRGCRVEVSVRLGGHPNATASDECVIGWGGLESPPGMIDRVIARASQKREVLRAPPRGNACAVLGPGVGGVVIHELVGHALEGDVVARRHTWILGGTLPEPERPLCILDDPRRGRGAWRIDDEGEPSAELVLVDSGHPTGILLDKDTAAALGKRSTGHGRRSSYLTATRPRMGCTFVAPGADDPVDVLRGTSRGVFIRRLTAGHTDPWLGRASFVVTEADEIVAGAIGAALQPFVIEIDGHDAWGSIDRVGHDLAFDTCVGSCVRDGQPLAVSVGAPTIRIGVMRVVS